MNFLHHIYIRHRNLVVAVSAVLCAAVLYQMFFSKPFRMWGNLNEQLDVTRDKLLAMEEALYRREQVEEQCKKFEQRILAAGTDAEELSFFLKELERLTRTSRVTVKSIRPLPSEWIGDYRKFFVLLEIEARIHSIFELLHGIEASSKILCVDSLKLQSLGTEPNLLSASILVSRTSAGTKLSKHR